MARNMPIPTKSTAGTRYIRRRPAVRSVLDHHLEVLRQVRGREQDLLELVPPELASGVRVAGRDEHGGGNARVLQAGARVLEVVGVVGDQEDLAARRHGLARLGMGGPPCVRRQLEVGQDDEVVGAGFGRPVPHDIDGLEVDRRTGSGGDLLGLLDPDLREIEPSDVVTLLGEPDGVAPLPAAEIQHPARLAALGSQRLS